MGQASFGKYQVSHLSMCTAVWNPFVGPHYHGYLLLPVSSCGLYVPHCLFLPCQFLLGLSMGLPHWHFPAAGFPAPGPSLAELLTLHSYLRRHRPLIQSPQQASTNKPESACHIPTTLYTSCLVPCLPSCPFSVSDRSVADFSLLCSMFIQKFWDVNLTEIELLRKNITDHRKRSDCQCSFCIHRPLGWADSLCLLPSPLLFNLHPEDKLEQSRRAGNRLRVTVKGVKTWFMVDKAPLRVEW